MRYNSNFDTRKQHWDGSDWKIIGDSRVIWPENETEFIGVFVGINKYF